ncbi:MAG: hypothetical protein JSU61_12660 [Fidelibacterota bacterium]|nr:MAG: hypothetical protein JSU61_12660 [Candidatus Neomarinimicrobiota bacterium]
MKKSILATSALLILAIGSCRESAEPVDLRAECSETLRQLVDRLVEVQVTDPANPDYGALTCPRCNVYHTRAAEAVYPFAVTYQQTGDPGYLQAAVLLGNWLIRQQQPGGEWKETPEEWTGTTTDQLLMMALTFPIIKDSLSIAERQTWERSIRAAADYLVRMMSPGFASINYCATTTASLVMTHRYFPDQRYVEKARDLAAQVLSKMDAAGFIHAEGGRIYGNKYGADVGYEIDMSLWGLALYALEVGDQEVLETVRHSLAEHLYFVYPNGAIDGSWGIRSNKWTTYGSATADGCQILFSLFAHEDPRCRTAAMKNLEYLRTMIKNGLIGYGPHYGQLFDGPPCIYPTFARSKNLAMAVAMGDQGPGPLALLPTEESGWFRHFPTVDVVLVRSENLLTTITAYRYKDLKRTYNSKYMHRPAGGSISNLWVEDHGFLQISSQTEYHRWEPMHFPELDSTHCLTPRIEFTDENGYFTNLYEYDGRLTVTPEQVGIIALVSTSGELTDRNLLPGGVAYTWEHTISDHAVDKRVELRYHGARPTVRIVEPIVEQPGMEFHEVNDRTVDIRGTERTFRFEVFEGNVTLTLGEDEERFYSIYPSIKAFPIVLEVPLQEKESKIKIHYRLSMQ